MKELDIKKIYGIPNAEDKLLAAIIMMQCIIECPHDTEVNQMRMEKFVSQFTKDDNEK